MAAKQSEKSALPIVIASATAALWSVAVTLISLILVFSIAWTFTADPRASIGDASKAAIAVWLLANSVPVTFSGLTIGLPPLLLSAAIVLGLYFGLRMAITNTIVETAAGAIGLIAAFSGAYAVLGALLTFVLKPNVAVNTSAALLGCALWAILASVVVLIRNRGARGRAPSPVFTQPGDRTQHRARVQAPGELLAGLYATTPVAVQLGIATACRFVAWILILATPLTILLFALNSNAVWQLISSLSQTGMQNAELIALCIAYLPTLLIWTVSVLIGPGFAIGGGQLSLFTQSIGPLPAVPFLAVIPAELSPVSYLTLALPAIAVFAAMRPSLRQVDQLKLRSRIAYLLSNGLATALLVSLLGSFAFGSLGAGRFQQVGPALPALAMISALWMLFINGLWLVARNKLRK